MDISRAKEIISALAEGVDPTTGEVLSEDSVCNKGEVVRALYAVLSACTLNEPPRKVAAKEPTDYDVELYERLKALRNKIAEERGLLPYRVFPNLPLKHLSAQKPTTQDEFLKVYGVGKYTAKQYGNAFISEIKDYINKARM